MTRIGTLDLRNNLAATLARVSAGEPLIITRSRTGRGAPEDVALLVPPTWTRPIVATSAEPPTLTIREAADGVSITLSGTVTLRAEAGSEAIVAGLRMLAGPAGVAVVRLPEGDGFVEQAGLLRVDRAKPERGPSGDLRERLRQHLLDVHMFVSGAGSWPEGATRSLALVDDLLDGGSDDG